MQEANRHRVPRRSCPRKTTVAAFASEHNPEQREQKAMALCDSESIALNRGARHAWRRYKALSAIGGWDPSIPVPPKPAPKGLPPKAKAAPKGLPPKASDLVREASVERVETAIDETAIVAKTAPVQGEVSHVVTKARCRNKETVTEATNTRIFRTNQYQHLFEAYWELFQDRGSIASKVGELTGEFPEFPAKAKFPEGDLKKAKRYRYARLGRDQQKLEKEKAEQQGEPGKPARTSTSRKSKR